MLWTIIGILLAIWLIGLVLNVVGGLIHILLVIAAAILVYKLVKGRM
ncbi:lmo0937 family membrane protein [Pseudalkalibacillus caeni]|uniref:Lmo0937 family membrane protein n=1 Tax=Exobacillus caeni TaxID=2574798 RepID=A0A5R9F1K3_9BACL|nr:lmo0937 family membrane protein [Pseudalkalibacillus caeni]TLS36901.1 lmo0937 family membrane protein [Pseudalkalibacillus caeni]